LQRKIKQPLGFFNIESDNFRLKKRSAFYKIGQKFHKLLKTSVHNQERENYSFIWKNKLESLKISKDKFFRHIKKQSLVDNP